ncbi:hypothetical protein AOXY_G36642 [Acipenser oxyrinchus oxyrinchus]|uniref:Uncharacterized protein n=1 Tax=Acipenser oxyrinchus oxyrinchus TaxID=40147 RepID=A0AAD8CEE4_ACIOX|nr:hypothetical protein AOXY_G36642 [Acipenser oxyrinchus oxyrinchus]
MLSWFFEKDKKQEDLIRASQCLHHCLHKFFSTTNKAFDILNSHLNGSFSHISVNESAGIKENCAEVSTAISKIREVTEHTDRLVQKSLEPHLYNKITLSGVSLQEKAEVAKELNQATMGILGGICGPIAAVLFTKSGLENFVSLDDQLTSSPVWSLTVADLLQSSRDISRLLCGAKSQRASLEEATRSLEEVQGVLKPACEAFDDIVCEVKAYIKLITEKM